MTLLCNGEPFIQKKKLVTTQTITINTLGTYLLITVLIYLICVFYDL